MIAYVSPVGDPVNIYNPVRWLRLICYSKHNRYQIAKNTLIQYSFTNITRLYTHEKMAYDRQPLTFFSGFV